MLSRKIASAVWVLLVLVSVSQDAKSKCITYKVQKNDTLAKISKRFLGSSNQWWKIYRNSELKTKRLRTGQTLYIYVPDKTDWAIACHNIVQQRLEELGISRPGLVNNVTSGIERAIQYEYGQKMLQSVEGMVRLCRLATASAEHESYYKFAVGAAGEIGMYQFKLDTARGVLNRFGVEDYNPMTDEDLVRALLDNTVAVFIYVLHISELIQKCGHTKCAFRRYNGSGPAAHIYAEAITERYIEISRIPAMPKCQHVTKE